MTEPMVDLSFTSADGTKGRVTADGKTITAKMGDQTISGSLADMDRRSTALLSVLLLLEDGDPLSAAAQGSEEPPAVQGSL